jgi:DNA-binding PadR family transcriptional regulator
MKHKHPHGFGHHFKIHDDTPPEHHRGGHHKHHRGGGHRPGRLFDYGELRLLVLAMLAEQPSHGYELIKTIEERLGGSYTPSPGVIYPTLTWLEDMGYTAVAPDAGSRKRYALTPEGEAFLVANRTAADALLARAKAPDDKRPGNPDPVFRAMENLKMALRLRFKRGPVEPAAAEAIAAAIDAAAKAVEQTVAEAPPAE